MTIFGVLSAGGVHPPPRPSVDLPTGSLANRASRKADTKWYQVVLNWYRWYCVLKVVPGTSPFRGYQYHFGHRIRVWDAKWYQDLGSGR